MSSNVPVLFDQPQFGIGLFAGDSFNRADGAPNTTDGLTGKYSDWRLPWSGSKMTISSNRAAISPTLGAELALNPGFDADANWTKGTGWTISGGVAVKAAGTASSLTQSILTANQWHQITYTIVTRTAGGVTTSWGGGVAGLISRTAPGTYTEIFRAGGAVGGLTADSAFAGTIDNVSVKKLTQADMFGLVDIGSTDITISALMHTVSGAPVGLALNWDSLTTPANGLVAFHTGSNIYLYKLVAGTWTQVYVIGFAYTDGAQLGAKTYISGGALKVRLYYNGSWVGAVEHSIADAGIISNTKHGLFGSLAAQWFDDFKIAKVVNGFAGRLVFDGDSLTIGTGVTLTIDAYPAQVAEALASNVFTLSNFGVGGQTLADMQSDAAAQIDTLYSAGNRNNILFVFGGVNDLNTQDGATAYARLVTYCNARRAVGWKIIIITLMLADQPAQWLGRRLDFNALVAANWASIADRVIRMDQDYLLGDTCVAGSTNNPALFSDQIHLTSAGYYHLAELALIQARSLIV